MFTLFTLLLISITTSVAVLRYVFVHLKVVLMKEKKIKYDCVFSLGEVCFCANFLRELNLRKFSAPFDWIAGGTFSQRLEFLINRFDNYFNEKDMAYHSRREFPEPRDIYYNRRTHIVFNHDFPINKPFDEAFPEVKEKYFRRIKRLYKLIQKSKKVLIVYMEQAETKSGINSDDELCTLMAKLNNEFPRTHIDLMYIRHNENMKSGEYDVQRINDYVTTAQCYDKGDNEDAIAVGNFHNVMPIFQNIRCKDNLFHSSAYMVYYWIRKIYKTLYRHKIRNGEEYIRLFGIKIFRRKLKEVSVPLIKSE